MKKIKIAKFTILALFVFVIAGVSPVAKAQIDEPQKPNTGTVSLYVWAPGGVVISWENPPKNGLVAYSCTAAIRNLQTGEIHNERTEKFQWVNENILFTLLFPFSGGNWEIVGGEDVMPTTACEAVGSDWGDHAILRESRFRDFRIKIYLPIVVR